MVSPSPIEIENFAQSAFLQNAVLDSDTQLTLNDHWGSVLSSTIPERWSNLVARCKDPGPEFREVKEFLERAINLAQGNLSWHLWPSTDSRLSNFLKSQFGFLFQVNCDAMYSPTQEIELNDDHAGILLSPLSEKLLPSYIEGSLESWGNTARSAPLLLNLLKARLPDPQYVTLVSHDTQGKVYGAVGAVIKGEWAYLKGDFVIPSMRKHGLYRKMIAQRLHTLHRRGVRHQVAITNQKTSSISYKNSGFISTHLIEVLISRPSEWVSV